MRWPRIPLCAAAATALVAGCFDSGTRWEGAPLVTAPPAPLCVVGGQRCALGKIQSCTEGADGATWTDMVDCSEQGMVCAPTLLQCTLCVPDQVECSGQNSFVCHHDGGGADFVDFCDNSKGIACREGVCQDLCQQASVERSNIGCEYWAADLDNAMLGVTDNAAAQQYAIVVSNAQPDVPVHVHVFQDDSIPGQPNAPKEVASATIAPYNLQVFKLGPREVDGSPPGQYNTGSNTALTRHAYKIVTDFPVSAYQFNPLDNVNVFSNDASLLKPREALDPGVNQLHTQYVVAGWPQTIAATDDPKTNFNPQDPTNLRAYLAIIGTHEDTTVRVRTKAAIVPGGPVAATPIGGIVEAKLGPFDVLNLESGDFNADFTGSTIDADQAIVVFSGTEASDAPHYDDLANRRCCADHLENQLDPLRTAGKSFAIAHNPSRTQAVAAAGVTTLGVVPEPDFVRFVCATDGGATIETTLPPPDDKIILKGLGDFREVTAYRDFVAKSSAPVHVAQIMASQEATTIPLTLPGGDPSLVIYPPTEQYRAHYVFLTPDKYAFDFVAIVAPPGAHVFLDSTAPKDFGCDVAPGDGLTDAERGSSTPPWVVYRCQLSFPIVDPTKTAPDNVDPADQDDGVHLVDADMPVGVIVSGFDLRVSYAYPAGTDLRDIAGPK